jgi:hypothetical protein
MVSKSQTEMRTELEKEGWTRQFTVDEPRLSEAVEMYKSLGFEVHLEPMRKLGGMCRLLRNHVRPL